MSAIKGATHNLTKGTTRPSKDIRRRVEISCKRLSMRALEVLEEAMDDPECDHRTKIMAAKEILDRAWGKPRIKVDAEVVHTPNEDFMRLMDKARQRAIEGQIIEAQVIEMQTKELEAIESDES